MNFRPGLDGHFRPTSSGLLTEEDLAGWVPTYEAPLSTGYAGYTVFKTGPWGQGPVFLQQLQLLEGFDLKAWAMARAEYVHVITECAKLSFADREAWYGDPHFADVPMAALLSKGLCRPSGENWFQTSPRPNCARGLTRGPPAPPTGPRAAPSWRQARATQLGPPQLWPSRLGHRPGAAPGRGNRKTG